MCAGLCPTYWTTFDIAERNRNGSCPQHEWDHPQFFEFLTTPPPAPQGPMDPTGGEGTSADIVPTQIIFGVDPCKRCWDIAQKPPKCKNSPLTPIVTKISFAPFFRPSGAANPQKGRRHIRNQSTPACELWRESARGLSRNRCVTNRQTYSKTNTSPFALTSEWRVTKNNTQQERIQKKTWWCCRRPMTGDNCRVALQFRQQIAYSASTYVPDGKVERWRHGLMAQRPTTRAVNLSRDLRASINRLFVPAMLVVVARYYCHRQKINVAAWWATTQRIVV